MVAPASALPHVLTAAEVAQALRRDPWTVREGLRDGTIPGFKVGHRWRVRREVVEALLNGEQPVTPAQQRAALLGDDTVAHLRDLAARAPDLSEQQRDLIRQAFTAAP